ncbi:DOPA 4,5-dioxygenase family protein [uncultured Ramlibacter sp.]|mgnify:CR=1 FL=1|uniref:DOPA 4,5-dioxygenase family protein n=1 Tax=uncultured Ramlibacter sp. TaxID=260755 RepID=UPI0026200FC8|nr:DOPA 4,5-dioxygenase family protein [uncultured Ramlibacter sp.]
MPRHPVNLHRAWHAHIYFDAASVEQARALATQAGELFKAQVGRVHEKEVGPHPRWSVQLAFSGQTFDALIPWLDAHRDGLDILVHGLSGDDLADHTDHAYWLGRDWPLKLEMFGG